MTKIFLWIILRKVGIKFKSNISSSTYWILYIVLLGEVCCPPGLILVMLPRDSWALYSLHTFINCCCFIWASMTLSWFNHCRVKPRQTLSRAVQGVSWSSLEQLEEGLEHRWSSLQSYWSKEMTLKGPIKFSGSMYDCKNGVIARNLAF